MDGGREENARSGARDVSEVLAANEVTVMKVVSIVDLGKVEAANEVVHGGSGSRRAGHAAGRQATTRSLVFQDDTRISQGFSYAGHEPATEPVMRCRATTVIYHFIYF